MQGVSWKTKVKSVFGKLGKCCFYLQYFLSNTDNDKSKQKYTQSHSSYKIETSHFWLGKFLSYHNWKESVKRTLYGLANTLRCCFKCWFDQLSVLVQERIPRCIRLSLIVTSLKLLTFVDTSTSAFGA